MSKQCNVRFIILMFALYFAACLYLPSAAGFFFRLCFADAKTDLKKQSQNQFSSDLFEILFFGVRMFNMWLVKNKILFLLQWKKIGSVLRFTPSIGAKRPVAVFT